MRRLHCLAERQQHALQVEPPLVPDRCGGRVALMEIADPMQAANTTTSKDCVNGIMAYATQANELGCNKTADPSLLVVAGGVRGALSLWLRCTRETGFPGAASAAGRCHGDGDHSEAMRLHEILQLVILGGG